MACILKLGKNWGLETFEDVIQKLASLESSDGKTHFKEFEIVTDLIFAAIESEKSNDITDLDKSDIMDWLIPNKEMIAKIVIAFNDSITGGKSKIPVSQKKK